MVWLEMGFGRAVGKHRWTETWGRLTSNPTRDKRGHSASTNRRNQKGKGWYGDIAAQETLIVNEGCRQCGLKHPS